MKKFAAVPDDRQSDLVVKTDISSFTIYSGGISLVSRVNSITLATCWYMLDIDIPVAES
jgi:hypothetical protein